VAGGRIFGENSSLRAVFLNRTAKAGSFGFSKKILPENPPIHLPDFGPKPKP
jgi:hypothetical protein